MAISNDHRKTLAWHETLEVHELVASQTIGLMKLKMGIKNVSDPQLKTIYRKSIQELELNIRELIKYYPSAPIQPQREEFRQNQSGFQAGELLSFCKASVRNYAVAITETATPVLRQTLTNHLNRAIKSHENIFHFMYTKGYYPAYDLGRLLQNDLKNADHALKMPFE